MYCSICGFEAKSASGLVNHKRQGGCEKRQNTLRYRSLKSQDVYGALGTIAYDAIEDKVQCHICGKWLYFLGGHVGKSHGISLADYKEEFGLNRHAALCGRANSHYRSELCTRLRTEGKFNLLPPPAKHDYERRLETKLKTARRERSEGERAELSIISKARLKRYKKECVKCGRSFWVKAPHKNLLAKKKYCPACRHIVKLDQRKEFVVRHHEKILERERTLRLIKREGILAQRPADFFQDLHDRRVAKAKEFWQRIDAYSKRSVEVSCISCGISFHVLAFLKRQTRLCPDCKEGVK